MRLTLESVCFVALIRITSVCNNLVDYLVVAVRGVGYIKKVCAIPAGTIDED